MERGQPDRETINAAVAPTCRAPSVHNTQPRRWRVGDRRVHPRTALAGLGWRAWCTGCPTRPTPTTSPQSSSPAADRPGPRSRRPRPVRAGDRHRPGGRAGTLAPRACPRLTRRAVHRNAGRPAARVPRRRTGRPALGRAGGRRAAAARHLLGRPPVHAARRRGHERRPARSHERRPGDLPAQPTTGGGRHARPRARRPALTPTPRRRRGRGAGGVVTPRTEIISW